MLCFTLRKIIPDDDEQYSKTFQTDFESTHARKTTADIENIVTSDKIVKRLNHSIIKSKSFLEHTHKANRPCSKMVWNRSEYRRLMKQIQCNLALTHNFQHLVDDWTLERERIALAVALERLVQKMEHSVNECNSKRNIAPPTFDAPKIYPNLSTLEKNSQEISIQDKLVTSKLYPNLESLDINSQQYPLPKPSLQSNIYPNLTNLQYNC